MNITAGCQLFAGYCRDERQLPASTLLAYKQDLAEFERFASGQLSLEAVTGGLLLSYVRYMSDSKHLAPATVKRRMACLRAMFGWFFRRGDINASPFDRLNLRIRVPARLARSLTTDEIRVILQDRHKACPTTILAVRLLFATGLRVSELTSIRLRDVNFVDRTIRIVGKGNRERQVFLPNDQIATAVLAHASLVGKRQAGNDWLFLNKAGSRLTAASLRARVATLARRAGLSRQVTPHMFRHTTATMLLESGVDIRFVQRLLGHNSIITTQLYTHVSDRALKTALFEAGPFQSIMRSAAAGQR